MKTILVVDDEENIREPLVSALTRAGYKALAAKDGFDAVAVASTNKIDLILLDLLMPGMHGTDAINQLRQKGTTAPVIVLTNVETTAIQEDVLEYIIKSETAIDTIVKRVNRVFQPQT